MSQVYYIIVDSRDRTLSGQGNYFGETEFGMVKEREWRAWHYESLVTANAMAREFAEKTGESFLVLTTQRRYVVNRTVTSQDFT